MAQHTKMNKDADKTRTTNKTRLGWQDKKREKQTQKGQTQRYSKPKIQ